MYKSLPDIHMSSFGQDETIREELAKLLASAYAPYSKFHVAAAVIDEDDKIHYGVNVENQSYPVGTCAEAGAIAAMFVAGGRRIKKLYLLSEPNVEAVPCGACRQRLAEFGERDTPIATFRTDGSLSIFRLEELFPNSFRFK
jgi:cytidine deaminase